MDREITITITEEEERRIQDRMDSGGFASAADFVATLLRIELEVDSGWMPSDDVLKELVLETRNDTRGALSPSDVHRQLIEEHGRHMAAPDSKIAR